jgi:general secretion pathway protein M
LRQSLEDRAARLQPRERRLIGLMLALALGAAMVRGVWQPVLAWREQAERAYLLAAAEHDALLGSAEAARPLGALHRQEKPLLALATDTARAEGLVILHAEPEERRLSLTLDDAPYAALIAWLRDLEETPGVRLETLSLTRTAPGHLRAQMTIGATGNATGGKR